MALYPTFETAAIVEDSNKKSASFNRSLNYDFNIGDITLDSAGRLENADGHNTWLQWCQKQLMTERMKFYGYSDAIGVELETAKGRLTRQSRESSMKRTITETLMADPAKRTSSVKDFSFVWKDDTVTISFVVWGRDGYTGRLQVTV